MAYKALHYPPLCMSLTLPLIAITLLCSSYSILLVYLIVLKILISSPLHVLFSVSEMLFFHIAQSQYHTLFSSLLNYYLS